MEEKEERAVDARDFARQIVEDPQYRANLTAYMIEHAGHAGQMEVLLHYYARGKPAEKVAVSGGVELRWMSGDGE